jgi:hypothetical protein
MFQRIFARLKVSFPKPASPDRSTISGHDASISSLLKRLVSRLQMTRSQLIEWLVPLGVIFVYLKILMGESFFSSSAFVGLSGDPKQYQWYIGWIWYALAHHQSPFITHDFNYPHATNLMNFTSVPLLGLLFGWLYPIVGVVVTYNLIFIANTLLIFILGKLTLQRLGASALFSSIGGVLFILLPYLISQELGHLNLFFIAGHLLFGFLLICHLTSARPLRWWDGLLLGVSLATIFYIGQEPFLSLFLFLGVLIVCALIVDRETTWKLASKLVKWQYVLGVVLGLLLVVPGLLNYLSGLSNKSLVSAGSPYLYSGDVISTIVPYIRLLFHPSDTVLLYKHITGNESEWNGYLSLPVLILFGAGTVFTWKSILTRLLFLSGTVMFVFSLGPTLHVNGDTHFPLPWLLFTHLPLFPYMLPARLAFYTQYCVVIVLALAATHYATLARGPQQRPLAVLNVATLVMVAALWFPALPYPTSSYPVTTQILAQPSVANQFLQGKHVLILQGRSDFPHIMGLLAVSKNYDVMAANVYGNGTAETAYPFILGLSLSVTDPRVYGGYLEAILPALDVQEIVYVAPENDEPLDPGIVAQTSAIVGSPIFTRLPYVAIWQKPATIKQDLLTYPLDALYAAASHWARSFPHEPLTIANLVQEGLLPPSFISPVKDADQHQTAYRGWVEDKSPGTVTLSVYCNEVEAKAMASKYRGRAQTIGYGPDVADAHAPPLPGQVEVGSEFAYLTLTFSLPTLARG